MARLLHVLHIRVPCRVLHNPPDGLDLVTWYPLLHIFKVLDAHRLIVLKFHATMGGGAWCVV